MSESQVGKRPLPILSTDDALARVGVRVISWDTIGVLLYCTRCAKKFAPAYKPDGTLQDRWWVCPTGCNQKATFRSLPDYESRREGVGFAASPALSYYSV